MQLLDLSDTIYVTSTVHAGSFVCDGVGSLEVDVSSLWVRRDFKIYLFISIKIRCLVALVSCL